MNDDPFEDEFECDNEIRFIDILESRIEVSVSVSIYTYFKISMIYREVYLFISKNLVYL